MNPINSVYDGRTGQSTNATQGPTERESRKSTPVWSGVLRYFPDAICAVARLSKKANDIHNPGEPLGWSQHKSNDHQDAEARHLLTPELLDDETQELHATAKAWRALADLQLLEQKRLGRESLAVQLVEHKEMEAKRAAVEKEAAGQKWEIWHSTPKASASAPTAGRDKQWSPWFKLSRQGVMGVPYMISSYTRVEYRPVPYRPAAGGPAHKYRFDDMAAEYRVLL